MAVKDSPRCRTVENPRLHGGEITISRYYPSAPGWRSLPLRSRIAWRLRGLADKIDRGLSYRLAGKWPSGMSDQDIFDAMCFGGTAMQSYMTDLQAERRNSL